MSAPEPWVFEPHNGYGGVDPDGIPWPIGYISAGVGNPLIALEDVLGRNSPEMVAHAHRMAAADDLYEALAVAVIAGVLPAAVRANAKSALAKARGEPSPTPHKEG